MINLADIRLSALIVALGLALAFALTAAWPVRYAASARIMLADQRIVALAREADHPQAAARPLHQELARYVEQKAQVLDPVMVRVRRPSLGLNLALGGGAGLALGMGVLLLRLRGRRRVKSERDLLSVLGPSLLAARPAREDTVRQLGAQLLEHWFTPERPFLAVVNAGPAEGGSRLAARLAVAVAEAGARTLVVDGDFRTPWLHRAFGLPNAHGLADFLQDRQVSLASAGANLNVMVAGSPAHDPLELLSRPRLAALLAEARKHFRVVLINTPVAQRGPDFQIFAALAGGALVVTHRARTEQAALARLRAGLEHCTAAVVATLIEED